MTKICAIITKNGTLDEIKKLVDPYQNHALSKKIVKTKEEWIDEYKEEIEIKLKKNAIKIEQLNELIKKSKKWFIKNQFRFRGCFKFLQQ